MLSVNRFDCQIAQHGAEGDGQQSVPVHAG